jgi:hypothetical protein
VTGCSPTHLGPSRSRGARHDDPQDPDPRLLGGAGDDGLDGGPGFDRLNGQAGVDSCVNGEVLRSCEATASAAQPLATAARTTSGYGRR